MSKQQNFTMLRKLLRVIGLSEDHVDEIITRIQEWLLDEKEGNAGEVQYPYNLRDDFLSPAELNFYRVLQTAVSDWAIIFTKVSLGDLFFAQTGDRYQNQGYRNKIDRKHVDFLLCDPQTIKPILGIELDDKSHQKPDRQARDLYVFTQGAGSEQGADVDAERQRRGTQCDLDEFLIAPVRFLEPCLEIVEPLLECIESCRSLVFDIGGGGRSCGSGRDRHAGQKAFKHCTSLHDR